MPGDEGRVVVPDLGRRVADIDLLVRAEIRVAVPVGVLLPQGPQLLVVLPEHEDVRVIVPWHEAPISGGSEKGPSGQGEGQPVGFAEFLKIQQDLQQLLLDPSNVL